MKTFGNAVGVLIPILLTLIVSGYTIIVSIDDLIIIIGIFVIIISVYVFVILFLRNKYLAIADFTDRLVKLLEEDMKRHSSGVENRPARMPPDELQISISLYTEIIQSIKQHGYFELEINNHEIEFDSNIPIEIRYVAPGMFKLFLVLVQIGKQRKYTRIYYSNYQSERDYTKSYFFHIFPLLGVYCSSISEKMAGGGFEDISNEYFEVSSYKIISHKKKRFIRIFID